MANCRQACPYNTLDGCKVKEYNAICPLTNMAKPITEYKMTNADRIRSMRDEELTGLIRVIYMSEECPLCTLECKTCFFQRSLCWDILRKRNRMAKTTSGIKKL